MILHLGLPTVFLPSIQQKVWSLIESGRYFDLKNLQDNPRYFMKLVPELMYFLDEQGLDINTVKQIFVMKADAGALTSVHCDSSPKLQRCLALNIPIRVDPKSRMIWYRHGTVESYRDHPYYGNHAVFKQPDYRDRLDVLSLIYPHLCRVDVLHNISNPVKTERFIVSLSFDPEPLTLWPESFEPHDISGLSIGDTYDFVT